MFEMEPQFPMHWPAMALSMDTMWLLGPHQYCRMMPRPRYRRLDKRRLRTPRRLTWSHVTSFTQLDRLVTRSAATLRASGTVFGGTSGPKGTEKSSRLAP
jgi:hypothetical protein